MTDSNTDMSQEEFFWGFLETQKRILDETVKIRRRDGVSFDVSPSQMGDYFMEFDSIVRPTYRPWAKADEDFYTKLPMHAKGEEVFSDEANMCLMRMGYYFGECLRKHSVNLSWAMGNPEYMGAGEPVISGFRFSKECSAIEVCRNIVSRISNGDQTYDHFEETYNVWLGFI